MSICVIIILLKFLFLYPGQATGMKYNLRNITSTRNNTFFFSQQRSDVLSTIGLSRQAQVYANLEVDVNNILALRKEAEFYAKSHWLLTDLEHSSRLLGNWCAAQNFYVQSILLKIKLNRGSIRQYFVYFFCYNFFLYW